MRTPRRSGLGDYGVYALLLGGTYLTWRLSYVDLGAANLPAALLIAAAKASLVAVFFMHVHRGPRLTRLVAGGSLFWLALLLTLTASDYLTR